MERETRLCLYHGETEFRPERQNKAGDTRWRCIACGYARQLKAYAKLKRRLVDASGGGCKICGYNRCMDALDFHHLDPKQKAFRLAEKRHGLAKKLEEIQKCLLLCCRCHREVEAGMVSLV